MPNLLIRELEQDIVDSLKERARLNGRSLQSELSVILAAAALKNRARTQLLSAKWLDRLSAPGRTHSNSTASIRKDRDR